jgi:hypothetical protein
LPTLCQNCGETTLVKVEVTGHPKLIGIWLACTNVSKCGIFIPYDCPALEEIQ